MKGKGEYEFFAGLTPEVTMIMGTCVMQLLVEEQDITKESIVEMIEALYFDDMNDLAVQLALDVLALK